MKIKYTVIPADDFKPEYIWAELGDDRVLCIPKDESNSDYQRYLRWLENPDAEEGGTL